MGELYFESNKFGKRKRMMFLCLVTGAGQITPFSISLLSLKLTIFLILLNLDNIHNFSNGVITDITALFTFSTL